MKIAIVKETANGEKRVAATPEVVAKWTKQGIAVAIESYAGDAAGFPDAEYKAAGATIAESAKSTMEKADVVLKVQGFASANDAGLSLLPKKALFVALLSPLDMPQMIPLYAKQGVNALSLEMIPRISRAQSMDVLSSQSNLAGYRAVVDAFATIGKVIPMMMTAAGTIKPSHVLVLGAGVAGLQAIATAKRMGAVVSAFDVRPAVKEQVESLGASFVEVAADEEADAETKGGYAKEMSAAYQARQREAVHAAVKKSDIVISTALIPGKPAPVLITKEMVADMRAGSVIVDLAASNGGNCELTTKDKLASKHGVSIIGNTNIVSAVAYDASQLFARNVYNLLQLMMSDDGKALAIDRGDQIVKEALLTWEGDVVHERFAGARAPKTTAPKASEKKAEKKPAAKKAPAKKAVGKKSPGRPKKAG